MRGTGHFLAASAFACLLIAGTNGITQPEEVSAIKYVRDRLSPRSINWATAMESWSCPTDPSSSQGECDVCSNNWSGNWEHVHCRGREGPYGEGSFGVRDGFITTIHITDVNLDGPVPREFCALTSLRELDLDGAQQTGPFPRWLGEPWPPGSDTQCLPNLQELDLSYNRLSGPLPKNIANKTSLQEIKIEGNFLTGSIPEEIAEMPNLWRLRLQNNRFSGKIPQSFSKMGGVLNELWLDGNNFEGDLSALGPTRLAYALVHNNPGLCGMIPASVRFAHGFNPAGTRLGQPC
ncbi:hypothetical protein DUNSADRAFT_8956 [Dunaliella salina]|uniref:Uncharacterized protein n=1 Tax=Dunaliella salina TaxID=3046 RepID=A0ABQ7GIH3_DUNSA|nr:hypothetical protein DUNSADRAFT_8956 [Dunaliella salina]|eukprot:KAF5834401.1 hypothetical protein DUNSADRAFT_8956 [Dunaliella salina]